ncbi:MAG: PAS domain S-box protein, partial [Thermoplasmata archaeon]
MRVEPSEGFRREASRRISANRSRVIDQWKANKEWFCKPHSRMSDDEIEEQGSRLLSYLIHFLEKGEKESLFDYAREEVKLRVSKGYRPEEVEDVMRFWNYLIIRTLRPEFRREECRETFAELVSKVFDEILDIVSMEAKKLYVSNLEALVEERTKELRESEEKFRNIFESANDGLACLDMSGKIVDVNERAAEIFGSSKKELVGKHSAELGMVFSETWSLFVNGLEQTLPGNAPLLNVTIRNAKGRDVDLECSASLLGNSEKPSGVLMVARDVTDRKRAEEAIKASEEQYRRLVQHSKDGILEVNLDGSVTFANPACKEIFGYSPEEFTANPDLVAQILHPDYVERFKEFWQKFRDEGRFSEEATEWCWIHKNGHTVYTENIFANLLNEKGDVIGFQSIARDITQRKQVQEALRRSEKEYRDLVDNALVGVFKTNLDGELLFANEAVLKILGYESPEESISEGIIARYKDVKRREELLRKLSKHGKVSDFEIEILTKTGETRHIIMSATLQGDIISGMLTDITERKKAEEELRRNEERLKILFENAPDACVLIDEEGAFVDGNKAAVEIFGYPKDEGRGKTIFNIGVLPPEEVSRAATNLTRTLKGEPTGPDEFVLIRRDGKRIVAEAKAYPVKIEGRDLILVTARDITDRKKAEEAKDRLLSNISHELRTPLTSIEGYTKFLLSGKIGALSRKQEKCLRIVNEESERLKGLIDN